AINHLRARRREAARRENADPAPLRRDLHHDPFDAELEAAIDRLPRRHREMIALKHIAGLTFDQIAVATGLNRNTAAARYRAAIEALQHHLDPGDHPGVRSHTPAAKSPLQEVRHVG